ncbi:MAG: 50S ribosomal protein L11 methyltransferase [Clostridia bacterium]|nr:50S ribosomal protein L11 methyltransferase [Clostridia bacterium]
MDNPKYMEITVSTTSSASDAVSDALMALGAAGTQILDRADLPDTDHPLHDWELMDQSVIDAMPEDVQVKAWYPEEEAARILETLAARLPLLRRTLSDPGTLKITTAEAEQTDWSENWKKYYKPFRAGKRLVIKPTWESWDRQEGDLVVEMDPGMAFGTGTHETTALCVEMIEEYYRGGAFLDVGTGSGILAICAGLLGAGDVTAVDIDPDAVRVAKENVEKNGLQGKVDVRQGDLIKGLDRSFDFAAANILAPIVCLLCGPLFSHLKPGSLFICSGILAEQEDTVRKALADSGYRVLEVRRKKDWVAFAAKRP